MSGLGRKMPWTFGAFALASLSMIGVPPVCGFVSKWYLINGAVSANYMVFMVALLASTILNASYFTPIVFRAFFMAPAVGVDHSHFTEAPMTMVVPLFFTALVSVLLGMYPQIFIQFIQTIKGF